VGGSHRLRGQAKTKTSPVTRAVKSAGVLSALILMLVGASTASAATVTFVPSFSNSGLGGGATFAAAFTVSGSEYFGEPEPLSKVTVDLPAGVGGTTSGFAACTKEMLEEDGVAECPSGSIAGPAGPIVMQVQLKPSEPPVVEEGTIQAVFAPEGQLYFYLQLTHPVIIEQILTSSYVADTPPYSHALTIEIPPVLSVPGAPNLSVTSMTLEFGASREEPTTTAYSVIIPEECPQGGFAWAADTTFEDASTSHLTATSVCPSFRAPPPPSHGGGSTTTTGSGSSAPPAPAPTGNISLASSTISVQSSGSAAVKLTCTGTATCSGQLTLTAKSATKKGKKKRTKMQTIGTASFSIPAGSTATIKPTLNSAGKSLLKAAHGNLSATLTILKTSPSPTQTNADAVHLAQKKVKKGKK
jgi:hypothetical protein